MNMISLHSVGRLVRIFAGLCLAISSENARANLIVNGSFEADSFAGPNGYRTNLVGNDVTGWFIPNSDGFYPWGFQNNNAYNAGPAADGNQWFILGEVDTDVQYTIQQTINGLVPGDTYSLSFALASENSCCSAVEVSLLSGSSTPAQNFVAPAGGLGWTTWETRLTSFVATSSSVTLQFKDLLGEGVDVGLDNVILVANVPEPSTLALTLAAMGIAMSARRHRKA